VALDNLSRKGPYFPNSLLSNFDLHSTLLYLATRTCRGYNGPQRPTLEGFFVYSSIILHVLEDILSATKSTHRIELSRREIEDDKALLQLLNVECREDEEGSGLAGPIRDRSGKMIEAVGKVEIQFYLSQHPQQPCAFVVPAAISHILGLSSSHTTAPVSIPRTRRSTSRYPSKISITSHGSASTFVSR
jgi:hypothetical protein